MQHAQRPQRLDEQHFAKVEVRELLVPLEKLLPLALLLIGRSREHHPQVLHTRAHGTVIQIDEQRAVLIPQQIAEMAVAVNANVVNRRRCGERRAHTLE